MKSALVSGKDMLQVFDGIPATLRLPNGDLVNGPALGKVSDAYSLLAVQEFKAPDGQERIGDPSFNLDGDAVVETYATRSLPPPVIAQAQAALDASDDVAIRCFKAGMPFPPEWQEYVGVLRTIVRSGKGELPQRPAYPAGS